MHFALIDFGIKAKHDAHDAERQGNFALIDFGIKAKRIGEYLKI